jgi:hypothetical protein
MERSNLQPRSSQSFSGKIFGPISNTVLGTDPSSYYRSVTHAHRPTLFFQHADSFTDGGGVRGISCLYMLKDIMSRIAGDPNAKPCEYFDLMAGTSTGG